MIPILIIGIPGLEDVLCEELEELGISGRAERHGRVRCEVPGLRDVVRLNLELRTAYRVLILLLEVELHAPVRDALREAAESIDFAKHMSAKQTFAVRGERRGQHDFNSQDLAADVGTAVVHSLRAKSGERVRADLEQPEVIFRALLRDNHLWIGLDTTGEPDLNARYPRPFHHFAPLRPVLASAMLRYAGYRPEVSLLDPMAGGATIPIEAALMAQGVPTDALRTAPYAFERLIAVSPEHVSQLRAERRETSPQTGPIRAADLYLKNMRGMVENIEAVGLSTSIETVRGNAAHLDYVKPGSVDLVVTNPPFGLRIADPVVVRKLYFGFARAAAQAEIPRLVVLTPQRSYLREAIASAGYQELEHRHVHYGKLETGLFRIALGAKT